MTAIKSFSYDLKDASSIATAEDKAKEQGKKFSQYLVELIKDDLKKKKDVDHSHSQQ